jgi:hypothetical protein
MEEPIKTVPSASAKMAGGKVPCKDKSTGFSECLRVRSSESPALHQPCLIAMCHEPQHGEKVCTH